MGFLNNNIIIVDAVLTKKGRQLLAKGQFNVTKFALADDQVNYALTQDQIKQTPVLQPSSDQNTAILNRLVTLGRDTTTISTIQIARTGQLNINSSNTITLNLINNAQVSLDLTNTQKLDTIFDIIVFEPAHGFVSDRIVQVTNGIRTITVKGKKTGNSKIQIIGRQTGAVAFVNLITTRE